MANARLSEAAQTKAEKAKIQRVSHLRRKYRKEKNADIKDYRQKILKNLEDYKKMTRDEKIRFAIEDKVCICKHANASGSATRAELNEDGPEERAGDFLWQSTAFFASRVRYSV